MKKTFKPALPLNVIAISAFAIFMCSACQQKDNYDVSKFENPGLIHESHEALTDIIVDDVFSPPVASRIYAYANIAAYETLVNAYPEYISLSGQLNDLNELPKPDPTKQYDFHLASVHAFNTMAKNLIFSKDKMETFQKELYDSLAAFIPDSVYKNSLEYGDTMAKAILAWSSTDGYKETRGMKYTVLNEPGMWAPTPPSYMDAVEPYWNRIRPFALDSASQFRPKAPSTFSLNEGSQFYEEVMEVYETGVNLTEEETAIASFWDCNPFVMHTVGHVMFATKKITPGGHWLGITRVVNEKTNADMMRSLEAYTLVAIALSDGFVSCWDAKFASNVIRPETVINAHIDEDWRPLLQTPPFPEYPSGHSVISKAAAVTLTSLYGDDFGFVDSSEIKYGLPTRTFDSFEDAANEAAISRLYGGIHYMPAIENGLAEGALVGQKVVASIKTKKEDKAKLVSSLEN